jgi:hypothetical protein
MRPYPLLCQGQQIWLSPERCIYWEEQQTLVLSDMHIGKSAHFRKAGIAIPQQVFQEDLHGFFQQVHILIIILIGFVKTGILQFSVHYQKYKKKNSSISYSVFTFPTNPHSTYSTWKIWSIT